MRKRRVYTTLKTKKAKDMTIRQIDYCKEHGIRFNTVYRVVWCDKHKAMISIGEYITWDFTQWANNLVAVMINHDTASKLPKELRKFLPLNDEQTPVWGKVLHGTMMFEGDTISIIPENTRLYHPAEKELIYDLRAER